MRARLTKTTLLNLVICAVSLSYGFLDWVVYRQQFFGHLDICRLSLYGGLDAPLQYRMGVWVLVCAMHRWLHTSVWLGLTLIDVAALGLILLCLMRLLRMNDEYEALPQTSRLLCVVIMLFLAEYYLIWGHWDQYPSTLPSCLFVCVSVLLVSESGIRGVMAGLLLIGLSCIQGFVRADVAVILHAGFFLSAWFANPKAIPRDRGWQMAISLISAFLAGCVQLYLMRVRFPSAKYGPEGVFQFANNLHPMQWMTAMLALLPLWLLLWLIAISSYLPDKITSMLLASSLLYILVWYAAGQLEEVRIFLPFGMALLPATCLGLQKWLMVAREI